MPDRLTESHHVVIVRSMNDRLKNRLRLWRIERGWTLEEMSDLTGYSVSQLSRAERGERGLSPEAKVCISRRTGVPIRDLFDLDDADEDVSGAA